MNWKPAVVAAVLVIAAGFATGVVVGGKNEASTVTETVVQTRSTPGTPVTTESTTPTTTAPDETTPDVPPEADRQPKYLSKSEEDIGEENISVESGTAKTNGEDFPYSVISYLFSGSSDDPSSFEYATDGYGQFTATLGFEPGNTNSKVQASLVIYKDHAGGTKLYSRTFDGAGKAVPVSFATRDATKLVFVFTNESPGDGYYDNSFFLGTARLEP